MHTRRSVTAALASLPLLQACGGSADFAESLVPGQGRLLLRADGRTEQAFSGQVDGRSFGASSPFRVASVSKVLVAELARQLHADGALDMDSDAGELIGYPLRHPEHPDRAVTLRHLVSHRSGIRDPEIYWMAAPGDIRDLLGPGIWEGGSVPGESFRYSNLNYGLAATVMEAATGERFDTLFARHVAEPLSLDIGFNWSGVSAARRASGFPGLRSGDGRDWEVQVDGADTLNSREPAVLFEPGWSVTDYEPGRNGTLFSPQGGLRASLSDLAVITREVVIAQPAIWQPLWQWDGTPRPDGPSEGGHFIAFGEGVYIYPADTSPLPGRRLVGHHGEAYGIYCGAWADVQSGDVFVHADLGSPAVGSPMQGGVPNLTLAATDAFAWWAARL